MSVRTFAHNLKISVAARRNAMEGNFGFATVLLNALKKHGNTCLVMISSIQATLAGRFGNSEYGRSKKAGEELMFKYGHETGAKRLYSTYLSYLPKGKGHLRSQDER